MALNTSNFSAFFILFAIIAQDAVLPTRADTKTKVSSSTFSTTEVDFSCENETSCDLNTSTVFTTENSIMTTILPKPTKKPVVPLPKINNLGKKFKSLNFCTCNLQVSYCDLNCCCDLDCTIEDKTVFSHCEEDFFDYDTRHCNYVKNVYQNFSVFPENINANGLFCVLKSNLPPNYLIQKSDPIQSFSEAKYQKKYKFSWPENKREEEYSTLGKNYVYGAPIYFFRENNTNIEKYHYYKSFFAPNCLYETDLKYLENVESNCLITEINEQKSEIQIGTYTNLVFITKPQLFNISQACLGKTCEKLSSIQLCDQNFLKCADFKTEKTIKCYFLNKTNVNQCFNVVNKIKFDFIHNGSSGINKIDLKFALTSITWPNWQLPSLQQYLTVNFKWLNRTLNYSSILSGNPGYLVGKPILFANLISKNVTKNATIKNYTQIYEIARNSTDYRSNFLTIAANQAGKCLFDLQNYFSVEFGYNSISKCEIDDKVSFALNFTGNEICKKLQNIVFKYWSLDDATNLTLENKLIGQFGNANANNSENWSRALFNTDLDDVLNNINGTLDLKTDKLTCWNLTSLMRIDVLHARVDFEHLKHQEKILATSFEFDKYSTFSGKVSNLKLYKQIEFRLKIVTEITFNDVTAPKKRRIVDPPSLKIQLPHDFFYPFVKLNNTGVSVKFSTCLSLSLYLCTYLISCVF